MVSCGPWGQAVWLPRPVRSVVPGGLYGAGRRVRGDRRPGQPVSVKLSNLNVICAVLGCQIGELLIPQPEKVPAPAPAELPVAAVAGTTPVVPRRPTGRSLPPA
jgi:hypothetical protein